MYVEATQTQATVGIETFCWKKFSLFCSYQKQRHFPLASVIYINSLLPCAPFVFQRPHFHFFIKS